MQQGVTSAVFCGHQPLLCSRKLLLFAAVQLSI